MTQAIKKNKLRLVHVEMNAFSHTIFDMPGYYAVRVGRVPGVYRTWDACKAQTHRFPGAVFKRFDNPWSAAKFVAATVKPPTTQRGLASFFKRVVPPK
jgi:viroplasmin and RNaseH domain-containing protein